MKKVWLAGAVALMSLTMAMPAFAGEWIQDQNRSANENGVSNWWYRNDDGSYPSNGWVWLDGNQDGVAESYCFNENGWMYVSTKIDGYDVNDSGAWIFEGQVVGKNVESFNTNGQGKNQWGQDNSGRKYFNSKGELEKGWKKLSGQWYYFDESGYALTGYHEVDGTPYYFHDNGQMATKTVRVASEGVYYVIDQDDHYVIDVVEDDEWSYYRNSVNQDYSSGQTSSSNKNTTSAAKQGETKTKSSLSDEEAYEKIIELKGSYPEGMRWTNDNRYGNGYGCAGFAFMVQDSVFGKGAPKTTVNQLVWEDLRVGDHLRVSYGGHSVIVLGIESDSITICEGNYNSSIHWGRTMSREELEAEFIYRQTCY